MDGVDRLEIAGVDSPADLSARLDATGYLADEGLATAAFLALRMGRPLFLEGEAGVGKTALARALADILDAPLIRLQCYEGLDAAQALYDWDFPRQLLHLRAAEAVGVSDVEAVERDLYDRRFLVARPLLQAIETSPSVLLVDEIDRADDEFEAFLLEVLSDWTISVPELGTIRAETPPVVVVTSNRTREVHDALKRRCLYHWLDHPDFDREVAIIRRRQPAATERLASDVARAAGDLRARGPAQAAGGRRVHRLDRGAARPRRPRARPRPRRPDARRGAEVPRGLRARPRCRPGDAGPVSTGPRPLSIVGTLVGFARTLRASGVEAGPDRVQAMVAALSGARRREPYRHLLGGAVDPVRGPRRPGALRPGLRRLVRRRGAGPLRPRTVVRVPREVAVPIPAAAAADDAGDPSRAATASEQEVLRHRDIARLTGPERDELRRMLALLRGPAPTRVSRRQRPAGRGRLDQRRTVRAMLERGGEPARLRHTQRSRRPRRLVLLVDVSGSMAPYADALLRFAHAAARRRPGTEVFTLGTRLTRVTRELADRSPDGALAAVSAAVADWSGGTRLGADLKDFLDRYGQRGVARGAVVVVASDGWERGDTAQLAEQMARLHRLAWRVVWVNPHKGRIGYEPLTAGMAAALPHVDDFVAGHSFAAYEELSILLSGTGRHHA